MKLSDTRLTVVGLGLMGGSVAAALRGVVANLIGVDQNPQTVDLAAHIGFVDHATMDLASALEACDLVLLANFIHHFDRETCVRLLRKVRAALIDGGHVATVEYAPNDDRVTPPRAAGFALVMLATTPAGDAYTSTELVQMFTEAGFSSTRQCTLPDSVHQIFISRR